MQSGTKTIVDLKDGLKCYCWTFSDGISITAVADNEYPQDSAFLVINSLALDFREYFEGNSDVYEDAVVDMDGKLDYPNAETILLKW